MVLVGARVQRGLLPQAAVQAELFQNGQGCELAAMRAGPVSRAKLDTEALPPQRIMFAHARQNRPRPKSFTQK